MKKFWLPMEIYTWALVYLLVTAFVKWLLLPQLLAILLYLVGGVIGLHLLEIEEQVFGGGPSPFRTVLAQVIITIMTFFVITSSGSKLGAGVVLLLNFRYLYLQFDEFRRKKSLESWLKSTNLFLTERNQRTYINILIGAFAVESLLFLLI